MCCCREVGCLQVGRGAAASLPVCMYVFVMLVLRSCVRAVLRNLNLLRGEASVVRRQMDSGCRRRFSPRDFFPWFDWGG